MEQAEIIYNIETMTENRKNVMEIFKSLKARFLTGKFTLQNLMKDYNYSLESANVTIDLLARNGLLDGKLTVNNTMVYEFQNDKLRQIENMNLWLERSKKEVEFFSLSIQVVQNEIKNKSNNLNVVK